MKVALTLLIALVLCGCGKKSDDQKPETSSQEQSSETVIEPQRGQAGIDDPVAQSDDQITAEQEDAPPTPPRNQSDPLKNKRWKLVELRGELIEVTDDFRSDPYITLSAHSNKMTGSGGCNRFGCKYDLQGDKITFNGFAATKVLCKEAMSVEEPFLRELAVVTGFVMDGEDRMWLLRDGKRVMKFEALYLN